MHGSRPPNARPARAALGRLSPFRHGALALLALLPSWLSAQEPLLPTAAPAIAPAPALTAPGVSPRGAFLRSLVVPGWGHAAIGSYTRGGFYFLAESAAGWMMVRTSRRLGAAAAVRDMRRAEARARLVSEGVVDPRQLTLAIADDERVGQAEELVESRDQQFEDWLVLGIFLAFLSGADAYVSTHLKDFPEPVSLEVRPGGVELGVSLPSPR